MKDPYTATFLDGRHFEQARKAFDLPNTDAIRELISNRYNRQGQRPAILELTSDTPAERFTVRGERALGAGALDASTFADALSLALTVPDSVIEWTCTDHVCALDVDFHGHTKPDPHALRMYAEIIKPAPGWFWLSRSGGLRLIYPSSGSYRADEVAAGAAYSLCQRFPYATFEFLKRSRRPPGEVFTRVPDPDLSALRGLLGETVEGEDFESWCAARGYVIGQRYPHTLCPVDPHPAAEGNTDPVWFHKDRVYCFVCAKNGKRRGHFSAAYLMGSRLTSRVANCVQKFTHWQHARYVLRPVLKTDELSRRVYSVLLRLTHGDDPRIPLVFTAGTDVGFVRHDGYWCNSAGEVWTGGKESAVIRSLPYAMTAELKPDPAKVDLLSQTFDLSPVGYYPLVPIRGIQLTQNQDLSESKIYTVLQTGKLADEANTKRRPRYIRASDRMSADAAWDVVRGIFPNVDSKLVELLLVGRGCMEHRSGLPPLLFLSGPTGSGKTGHVYLAAAIAGDLATEISYNKDQERMRQAMLAAKTESGILIFDEFFKCARRAGHDECLAAESLLSFGPRSMSHVMYVGPVAMGELPFCVFADVTIPASVLGNSQIGRRAFIHVMLRSLDWIPSLKAHGIHDLPQARLQGPPELVEAFNCILSHVIDTYFAGDATDFGAVAELLGFRRINQSETLEEIKAAVRALFDAVCEAPDITDANDRKQFSRPGYKLARDGDELHRLLDHLQGPDEKGTERCRLLDETDIAAVCGLTEPTRCMIRQHGRKFAIRFHAVDDQSKYNGALRNAPVELAAD